jgi:ribosomal protein S6 kinase alpha-5
VFLVRKRDGADAGRFYAMKMMDKADMIKRNRCERVVFERIVLKWIGDELFLVKLHYAFQTESKLFLVTGENIKKLCR